MDQRRSFLPLGIAASVFVLLGAGAVALLGPVVREQRAARAVERCGGSVERAHEAEYVEGQMVMRRIDAPPPGPEIAKRWFGENCLAKVVSLEFAGDLTGCGEKPDLSAFRTLRMAMLLAADESDVRALTALPQLRVLDLRRSGVSDRELSAVAGNLSLQGLILPQTRITDDSLAVVASVENLMALDASGCRIRGRGLVHLRRMARLAKLYLAATEIDDSCADAIAEITSVEELDVSRTRISDDALTRLAGMPRIRLLLMAECPNVSDSAAARISEAHRDLTIVR